MNKNDYLQALKEQEQAEAIKKAALFNFMTKEARERFRRVEMAHPENAQKALMMVLQGVQAGRFKQVSDKMLKKILITINDNKEYNFVRR